jgi:hypothetical protein
MPSGLVRTLLLHGAHADQANKHGATPQNARVREQGGNGGGERVVFE